MPRRKNRDAQASDGQSAIAQLAREPVINRFAPVEMLDGEQVERMHHASLDVLEDVGVEMMLPEARELLVRSGGASRRGENQVRIERDLVESCLKTVRPSFTVHARNPENDVEFGTSRINFATVGSPPNASDLDGGRRTGNGEDYRNLLRLAQHFNIVHLFGGYPVEPVDWPVSVRHLRCLREFAVLSDKVFHVYSLGSRQIRDGLEIVRIARGVDEERLEREPSALTVVNSNSPLRFDANMTRGIIDMSARNQVVVLTPFTLSGAMAPVTLAGAIVQQNAEVLAGLVISQLTRPGAPFIYGGFTSNVDMRSGAPAFGTPEYVKAALATGQMARRYGLPFRSSNTNASNCVDAQSAYESVFSLWGAVNGHAHLVLHAAGWLEGGLTASFEKFVVDVELLQVIAEYMKPMTVNDEEIGIESMKEAGPGGHFFGTRHTQARYRDAFYEPIVSDWRNFETWKEAGSPQTMHHANSRYKQILAEYEEPYMAPDVREELDAFVEGRIAEGGVPTEF